MKGCPIKMMKNRIAVVAIMALLGATFAGCSHGISTLPATTQGTAQQPSGPRAAGATDDLDGCPPGSYTNGNGGCMQDIGGTSTVCGYTCSSDQSPCVADPSLCTVTQPGSGGGGGGGGDEVACVGTPTSCQNVPCNNSQMSVGTIFTDPQGHSARVTDINSITQYDGSSSQNVGWIYEATVFTPPNTHSTKRYIQGDLSTNDGIHFSIDFGFGSLDPSSGGWTEIRNYSGQWPPPGIGSGNVAANRCETQGTILV